MDMARRMSGWQETLNKEISGLVGAGRSETLETVDFSDPNRPKTCLEIDFPILPVNKVAVIEGNAGKPIYQMSKWWARRHSRIFGPCFSLPPSRHLPTQLMRRRRYGIHITGTISGKGHLSI